MACGLVASNLNLKPGECLRVRGEVAPDAKSFVLNLGKDNNHLCLHFNPRFNAHGDTNTIVCNSKDGGAWGAEHREPAFPFQPGSVAEVHSTHGVLRGRQVRWGLELAETASSPPVPPSFVLNLGKDNNHLCLHFNPRFNAHGDTNTIVCNSKDGGAWGAEHREPAFPFQPGSVAEICVSFDQTDLTIKLPDGHEFKFPNRLNLEAINYLAADGDFKIKCVAFE
ncbi:Galectin-1 [Heterocephalus glaber]|uniref:Galectin n=1 Tax=Heterocephalus glaber TaxID=10181 RepID=G5AYX7_HETGA|nr:Galectin-1 [Heterocephalus glaber]